MTLTTPYSATFYVGDGETKTFPYLFEEVSESFISVIVYNSLTGQSSTPTYIVDTDQKQVIFGDDTPAPTADETVCIYRNTPNVQDTPFRTLQGYDAKALENILSKIVAMIQEIKSNYFTTQVLQGDPWQLDLLTSADDGATVNIDYTAKKLVKGLYFRINNGNLQVSADGNSYITMPKSSDIVEFRQTQTIKEDLTVEYRLQYRIGNTWYNAESNAESKAQQAIEIAEEARDIADDAKDVADEAKQIADDVDEIAEEARNTANDAKDTADDAKEIAQDAKDIADSFDSRLTQAEQDASDAKTAAQGAVGAVGNKVDKTTVANKVYGTDADGNQTTYDKGGFGQVDDVQVNNVSVVTNKVANIDLTPYVTLSTTQAITGTKTFKAEILSWNNITFESAQVNPIIRGMSGASYRNMITRTNSASAIDVGNTSDTINFKGSGTRPTYNSNNLAMYSDIGNGTITITQGGTTMGSFTTNQSGDQTIALDSGSYHPDLFDVKWSDHICNDVQWLRADTFSWQDGTVYEEAYQHLLDDALTSVAASETIAGTQIRYLLAQDGHKIVDPTEESNVVAIYNATGVAWYYIVDPTNHRFKLPRTKFGFTGIRSGVGGYVEAGLPDHNHKIIINTKWGSQNNNNGPNWCGDDATRATNVPATSTNASTSNSIYGNSDTVQPPATQMYLYFYVGNFTQTALENTAGITTEELNDKLDLDAGNATNITKKTIVGWGMPDYTAGISLDGRSTPYTAPQDGIISVERNLGTIKVNDNYIATSSQTYSSYSVIFPVSKDDVVSWTNGNIYLGVFYPFKGVN